jgi:hypothetical protein
MTQTMPAALAATRLRTSERVFYLAMSLLMIGTILLGFRATYFPLGPKPPALGSKVILAHGIIFSAFLFVFFLQSVLITTRRPRIHMTLGLWLYGLAAVMVPLGVVSAADEMRRALAKGGQIIWEFNTPFHVDPKTFSIVSCTGMVVFGSLILLSYLYRRQPFVHKRLALYATLSLVDAGFDRWPWDSWGISQGWVEWVFTALLLLPVLYDLLTRKRIPRVILLAAPYVWILHTFRLTIGKTAPWHVVADWMLKHLT